MSEYKKNLKRLNILKTFKGGDNEDVPLHKNAISDMEYLVELCKYHSLPQPEIFPWSGGNGIQAEWSYDWYLEIDSAHNGISILFVKEKYYDSAISMYVKDIEEAFKLVTVFLNHVVDLNGSR